jgi:cytoskeleton protein RodZ
MSESSSAVLKSAREEQKMSVADVASRLRMSTKQIDYLEACEWAKLPGDAFARGALRSYGKLLNVDVTGLLAEIGGFGQAAEVRPAASLATRMPRQGAYGFDSTGRNSWLAWSLLAVIALAAIGFFYGGDKLMGSAKPVPASAPAPSAAPVTPPDAPTTPSAPIPAAVPAPVSVAPAVAEPAPPPASVNPSVVSSAVNSENRLELLSDKAAWIEVKGADSKVLFSGYLAANTAKVFESATPPLRLVIGSARSVKATWRGQALDVLGKTKDDVARLTIE